MNARQKAKRYKQQLIELYADYVQSAQMTHDIFEVAQKRIWDIKSKEVTCSVEKTFTEPIDISEDLAIELWEQLTYDPTFRQAVTFEGHTDPDTGKYILKAELTVVMPEVKDEEEE